MSRRRFSEREVLETLMYSGMKIYCYRCHLPFLFMELCLIEREHLLEKALAGEDAPNNCAYSHKACHAKITNGTKATTAGSSKQRIAKTKRIIRTCKFEVNRHLDLADMLGADKPKRKWPKRELQGRGFQRKGA